MSLNQQKIWSDQTFEQTLAIYFDSYFKSVVILICFPQSVRLYYRPRTNEEPRTQLAEMESAVIIMVCEIQARSGIIPTSREHFFVCVGL